MKRLLVLAVFLSAAAAFLSAGGAGESAGAPVTGFTGVVQYLEGEVTMDGRPLEIGDRVVSGSTFVTAPDSSCEILFGGKNIFRIQENTVVVITLKKGQGELDLQKGGMALVLQKLETLGSREPEFGVTTPSASLGVRGTAFFVQVESESSTYICACNGTLQVEDGKSRQSQDLTGTHHKALRFEARADGTYEAGPAPMLYHDDGDLDSLAAEIGETIPWGAGGY